MKEIIKKLLLIFVLIIIVSCNNSSKTNGLVMLMDVVIKKTDSFQVFYKTNHSIKFNETETLFIKVKGSDKNQKIQIIFPDTIQPKQIRLDLGRNIKQPEIIVNEMKFSYKDKDFTAKGEEIYHLFRVDDSNTTINKFTGSLKRKDKNQITGPSLYPNGDKLYRKLNQLYTDKSEN